MIIVDFNRIIERYPTRLYRLFDREELSNVLREFPNLNLDVFQQKLNAMGNVRVESKAVIHATELLTLIKETYENKG